MKLSRSQRFLSSMNKTRGLNLLANQRSFASIIGIDLGTTNSCVAIIEGGQAKVLENSEGMRTTPSMVAFSKEGETLVGVPAKRQAVINPADTIFAAKRLIGRRFDEADIQKEVGKLPYKVVKASNGDAWINANGKDYSPAQIGAVVLTKMKETAESYLNDKITQAVVTVPAYFNDSQRQATKTAGVIAGLEVERIINEPTAAALAYGIDPSNDGKTIAVYDLGGGTFDISILGIKDGVFEVKSTNGNTSLGGEDFDNALIYHLIDVFHKQSGINLKNDNVALQRVKEAAEKAKIELDSATVSEINLPYIAMSDGTPQHMAMKITKEEYENLVADIIEKTHEPCKKCMIDANLQKHQIDEILLVGGMTRMPKVQNFVEKFFGRRPNKGLNPDEAVAVGACLQGGVLQGDVKDIVLLDVTPLSLGTQVIGDVFVRLIHRNTPVPVKKSDTFTTTADNQTSLDIKVFQGEREIASQNKLLGQFSLMGIPPAPKGVPKIEITYEIDPNGITNVTGKDLGTGKSQSIAVKSRGGLTDQQVQQMLDEAERMKEQDKIFKEKAQLKNEAESAINTAETNISDHDDQIPDSLKDELWAQIETVQDLIRGDDTDALKAAVAELQQKVSKIGEHVYGQGKEEPSDEKKEE